MLYLLSCSYVGCIYIYTRLIFLVWSFVHYVVSFFVFCNSLYFSLFCLIWVLLLQLSFDCHFHWKPFSISLSVCLYPWIRSGTLINSTHTYRSFFVIHSASLCHLVEAFNPFTFKVVICTYVLLGFPGGSAMKNLPASAGDMRTIPGSGSYPGEGNGNPLQNSCLGNLMHRGAWQAIGHGVVKDSDTT